MYGSRWAPIALDSGFRRNDERLGAINRVPTKNYPCELPRHPPEHAPRKGTCWRPVVAAAWSQYSLAAGTPALGIQRGGHVMPCPYGASIGVLRLFTYPSQSAPLR